MSSPLMSSSLASGSSVTVRSLLGNPLSSLCPSLACAHLCSLSLPLKFKNNTLKSDSINCKDVYSCCRGPSFSPNRRTVPAWSRFAGGQGKDAMRVKTETTPGKMNRNDCPRLGSDPSLGPFITDSRAAKKLKAACETRIGHFRGITRHSLLNPRGAASVAPERLFADVVARPRGHGRSLRGTAKRWETVRGDTPGGLPEMPREPSRLEETPTTCPLQWLRFCLSARGSHSGIFPGRRSPGRKGPWTSAREED